MLEERADAALKDRALAWHWCRNWSSFTAAIFTSRANWTRAAYSELANCFALPAALGIPSAASRIFGRKAKDPPTQSICHPRNKCRSCLREKCQAKIRLLSAANKRNAGHIEPRQDVLRCRPPVKRSAENRAFLRASGSRRRHFHPFAANPNRQPEIQKNRWKSAEVPELFCSCGKSQIFGGTFQFFSWRSENSAEFLILRPTTSFSAEDLDFQLNIAIFRRKFFFSAENLSFRAEIRIFARRGLPSSRRFEFSAEVADFQRQI